MKKFVWISVLFFVSCSKPKPKLVGPVLVDYIELEGRAIQVIEDEYGNTFLKQAVSDERFIYIPFTYVTSDTLRASEAKKTSK